MEMMDQSRIPIIIPAYEPDKKLTELIEKLVGNGLKNIIIVDDGSGENFKSIFDSATALGATVL